MGVTAEEAAEAPDAAEGDKEAINGPVHENAGYETDYIDYMIAVLWIQMRRWM